MTSTQQNEKQQSESPHTLTLLAVRSEDSLRQKALNSNLRLAVTWEQPPNHSSQVRREAGSDAGIFTNTDTSVVKCQD